MEQFYKQIFMAGAADPFTPGAERRFAAYYATRTDATKRSYGASWKRFSGFLSRKKLDFHGMQEHDAAEFLQELDDGGATASQLQSTAAVASWAAEAGRTENPFASPIVKKIRQNLATEATIAGRTKSKKRRPMEQRDYRAFQDWFWSQDSSPMDREVCVLACITYLGQRR